MEVIGQPLFDALVSRHGFSRQPSVRDPETECVEKHGVEISGLALPDGLRIDISLRGERLVETALFGVYSSASTRYLGAKEHGFFQLDQLEEAIAHCISLAWCGAYIVDPDFCGKV